MIRINLLTVERKPTAPVVDLGQKITIGCSLLLVATAALIGWRYWTLHQESLQLDEDIVAAKAETERLRVVLVEVADFERRRTQLQQRVALIEELRKDQSGPVHLLDELSRALPDRLWLTQMQQQEKDLRVEGRTTSLTSLSDFVGNLESSGYFTRPVEIVDSQVEAQRGAQPGAGPDEIVRFTIRAQFAMPGSKPAEPQAEAASPSKPVIKRAAH